jgi:hypothetical protein
VAALVDRREAPLVDLTGAVEADVDGGGLAAHRHHHHVHLTGRHLDVDDRAAVARLVAVTFTPVPHPAS